MSNVMSWGQNFINLYLNHSFSAPWGRGSEALSWEAWAWKGSATESSGGEQQLQQDGRGEAQSEDGGQQGEPHSNYGSNEWEIQGEGQCLNLSLKDSLAPLFLPGCWILTRLSFSSTGQEVGGGAEEQRNQRSLLWRRHFGKLKATKGIVCIGFFYVSKDWFIFRLASISLCSLPTFLK